jgi:hydrogenase expression/formation protein HypE
MDKTVLLAHGSGGKLAHELITGTILPSITNAFLQKMDDSAVFEIAGRLAFTTDSFVVNPPFFPGGDIGKLSICGTINDLSMVGAKPLYLSLALIIEEGFSLPDLQKVMDSIRQVTQETGVKVVTGDTKVVNHGSADKIFINTAGIGIIPPGVNISGSNALPGDKIILSGSIGDHGIAVMAQRQGLRFKVPVKSDCAPLNSLVEGMLQFPGQIHSLRDPTRGGLATTLNELAKQSGKGFRIFEDSIPVKDSVSSACGMLGLDPLYVANEGKLIAVAAPEGVQEILSAMRRNPYASDSTIIGEVVADYPGRVVMKTRLGASRIVDMLHGEILPRIC